MKKLNFYVKIMKYRFLHRRCFIGKKRHFYSGYTQAIQCYQENDESTDTLKP